MRPCHFYLVIVLGLSSFAIFLRGPPSLEYRARILPMTRASRRHGPGLGFYGPRLEHIQFDPIVGEMEMRKEDLVWEKEHIREAREEALGDTADIQDSHQDHDTRSDEDSLFSSSPQGLNLTERLFTLFPLIDTDQDNSISLQELTAWHQALAKNASLHRSGRELATCDTDNNRRVTIQEYLHDPLEGTPGGKEWPAHTQEWLKSTREMWPLADLDKDGALDLLEFNDFLHPEDSENEHLLRFLRVQEIRDRDTHKDGRISFTEFATTMFDELRDFKREEDEDDAEAERLRRRTEGPGADRDDRPRGRAEYISEQQSKSNKRLARARHYFDELDVNRDSFITEEELGPVMEKLQPGENYYARTHSESLISQADDNKDRQLSLDEMLAHANVFYNTAVEEEEDALIHDEFR